jgi:hypothetical protein
MPWGIDPKHCIILWSLEIALGFDELARFSARVIVDARLGGQDVEVGTREQGKTYLAARERGSSSLVRIGRLSILSLFACGGGDLIPRLLAGDTSLALFSGLLSLSLSLSLPSLLGERTYTGSYPSRLGDLPLVLTL